MPLDPSMFSSSIQYQAPEVDLKGVGNTMSMMESLGQRSKGLSLNAIKDIPTPDTPVQQAGKERQSLLDWVNMNSSTPRPQIDENMPVDPNNTAGLVGTYGTKTPQGSVGDYKPYLEIARAASKEYGVPLGNILAVMQAESNFRGDAVSPTGVRGPMQVTGKTYEGLGFTGDRSDPTNSIRAGTKLLSQLAKQYGNNWEDVYAAYNGGHQAVLGMRYGNWGNMDAAKIKEVMGYVPRVHGNYHTYWSGDEYN